MKVVLSRVTLLLIVACCSLTVQAQQKLRRADSFFGFHFDFHAVAADKELGKNFDESLLDKFLQRTKPDYIQIDSKGHFGYSSYPTSVGYSNDSFIQDPIRVWKNMADRHHLPLYVHYSGILDHEAIRRHPEWARLNPDGSTDTTRVGFLSAYNDQLLIPQLKELIDNYDIDGAWLDGDCWASLPDYSEDMKAAFLKETGLREVPVDMKDTNFPIWREYNKQAFKNYMRHYVNELKRYRPDFQITSNWAYSSQMPEPVDVNFDFLSGDVAGKNCVYSAAFESRCMALQGKPWDLMSWGMIPPNFWGGTHTTKPVIQLKQEAAQTIAMGGGYQVYFRQNRDGAFQTLDTDALGGLADFVRERQPFCEGSEPIPTIGIWYSLEGWKELNKDNRNIYRNGRNIQVARGTLNLLMDGHHSVEILMDHHLRTRMNQYALIVIPEWVAFEPGLKQQLLQYVHAGGQLLVIGAAASSHFQEQLQVSFDGEVRTNAELMIGHNEMGGIAGLKTAWQPVIAKPGTQIVGNIFSQLDYRYPTEHTLASINAYGKGRIGAVYLDLSVADELYRNPVFVNLVADMVKRLVPNQVLEVSGSQYVHTVLSQKNGKVMVHLLNVGGEHANERVFGYTELRPTLPVQVSLKTPAKPKEVLLQPYGTKLDFEYTEGRIRVNVPPVAVHDIVEIVK